MPGAGEGQKGAAAKRDSEGRRPPGPGSVLPPGPGRRRRTGYKPPLEVLLSAVLAADCMAEAAPEGEFDPARAPFTFW